MPAYNHRAYVAEALESVLAQDYPDLEVVVADDGSTDGTADVIREFAASDPRVVALLSAANVGISANHNRALDRATGEFVALLASDDVMMPGKLTAQAAFMRARPECGVSVHDMEIFDSATGRTLYRLYDRFAPKNGGDEVMFTSNWLFGREIKSIPSSHMFRASVLARYPEQFRIMNEWLFEIESLHPSGLQWASIPEVLGRYRVHPGQLSQTEVAFSAAHEEALQVLAIVSVRYPELAPLVKRKRNFLLFRQFVYDEAPAPRRPAVARQLRVEAGIVRWAYARATHLVLAHRWLIGATRPARRVAQWLANRA
jgi:glycosyltransferase involved in cell wall biosynthesis